MAVARDVGPTIRAIPSNTHPHIMACASGAPPHDVVPGSASPPGAADTRCCLRAAMSVPRHHMAQCCEAHTARLAVRGSEALAARHSSRVCQPRRSAGRTRGRHLVGRTRVPQGVVVPRASHIGRGVHGTTGVHMNQRQRGWHVYDGCMGLKRITFQQSQHGVCYNDTEHTAGQCSRVCCNNGHAHASL